MAGSSLHDAYVGRGAEARAAGQPVIGLIGADLPREIVLAAGALPVAVTAGDHRATPNADIYLDDIVSPEDHDLFEAAVEGRFAGFDLLVLSRPYQHLFYFLKEIYRLGRAPKLPPVWLFDLMPSRRESVRVYNTGCLADLAEQAGRATGRLITDAALHEAIVRMNRVRAARRRIESLRAEGLLSGTEALEAHGAAAFMAPEDYVAAVETHLDAAARRAPSPSAGPGVLVASAEPMSSLHLHELIETAGARVLAEDDVWGSRGADDDVAADGDPMAALLDAYWMRSASRDAYPPEQADLWFDRQLERPDIGGVVFYIPPSDHRFGWDYPRLLAKAEAAGKASLLIRDDVALPAGRAAAAAKVTAFANAAETRALEAQPR